MQLNGNNESNGLKSSHRMSPVNQMFNGRSVFITGASGFIGRVLLEKLLRTYQGINKIYILMRSKRKLQPYDRLNKLLDAPIFDKIRDMENGQTLLDKLVIVPGDISEPRLGLSDESYEKLINDETLSIVFHSAATIRFDEPLKVSVKLNLIATREIIKFCRKLQNLVGYCQVSTAYVNSDIKNGQWIEEKLYPINEKPGTLIKLAEVMDEDLMQMVMVKLVDQRPNTYTYTKALAEHLIMEEAADLPVVIVRPSIVAASWKEPFEGWVDNLNGPTGIILAIGKGLLRSTLADRSVTGDIIPVDIVVNTLIAATFYAAKKYNKLNSSSSEYLSLKDNDMSTKNSKVNGQSEPEVEKISYPRPTIVHCNSGEVNPVSWGETEDMFFSIARRYPSSQVFRYPFGSFKSNKYHDFVTRLFVHYLPALIIDMICGLVGRKQQLLSIYGRIHGAMEFLTHFVIQNYHFKTENMKLVQSTLNEVDKRELYLDISSINWNNFWDRYILGVRRYVLKEPDDTLDEARKSLNRAYWYEMCFRTLVLTLAVALCLPLSTKIESNDLVSNALLTLRVGLN